jgi:hypothetical protein
MVLKFISNIRYRMMLLFQELCKYFEVESFEKEEFEKLNQYQRKLKKQNEMLSVMNRIKFNIKDEKDHPNKEFKVLNLFQEKK